MLEAWYRISQRLAPFCFFIFLLPFRSGAGSFSNGSRVHLRFSLLLTYLFLFSCSLGWCWIDSCFWTDCGSHKPVFKTWFFIYVHPSDMHIMVQLNWCFRLCSTTRVFSSSKWNSRVRRVERKWRYPVSGNTRPLASSVPKAKRILVEYPAVDSFPVAITLANAFAMLYILLLTNLRWATQFKNFPDFL